MNRSSSSGLDIVRQVLTVVGAIFQVAAGAWAGPQMSGIANEFRSTILPSGWAFSIWGPIFLLAGIYAVWQALPANRENPLLRRVGWFIAAGYIGNGVWELVFPARQFIIAQVVIVAILVVLAAAFLQTIRTHREQPLSVTERWLVAMPLGLYFGWITAATNVGMAATLTVYDIADAGTAAVTLGVVLLVVSGAIALAMIRSAHTGPREGWIAYAAAIVWALIGVTANQLEASPVTAGAAIAIGVIVLAVVVWQLVTTMQRGTRAVTA